MDSESRKQKASELFQEAYKHQKKGELNRAVELYKESLRCFPTAEAYTFLGWTYSSMGRLDDAIAECHKAIECDPDFGNPYNDIGAYLMQKGQIEEAIPWLERALEAPRYESYCYPHMNLGRAYEMNHQYARAIEEYRLAMRENPDYAEAKQAIARIQGMLN